jgi:hypothetical protein
VYQYYLPHAVLNSEGSGRDFSHFLAPGYYVHVMPLEKLDALAENDNFRIHKKQRLIDPSENSHERADAGKVPLTPIQGAFGKQAGSGKGCMGPAAPGVPLDGGPPMPKPPPVANSRAPASPPVPATVAQAPEGPSVVFDLIQVLDRPPVRGWYWLI